MADEKVAQHEASHATRGRPAQGREKRPRRTRSEEAVRGARRSARTAMSRETIVPGLPAQAELQARTSGCPHDGRHVAQPPRRALRARDGGHADLHRRGEAAASPSSPTAGDVHRFRKGTYLCHQGDDADDVYFLVEGKVEMSSVISPTGTRVLHATRRPSAVPRRARRLRGDRRDRRPAHARGLGGLGRRRRALRRVRDERAGGRARACSRRSPGRSQRAPGVRRRPALPRPQGPRREAAPADGDADPRSTCPTTAP